MSAVPQARESREPRTDPADGVHLYGRDRELAVLSRLVDHASEDGGALVGRGEAGIGKSSLLAHNSRHATARGLRMLAISGA